MLGSNKFFVVNNYYDLVGLETLWQITLNTKNDIVYKKSIDLMNQTCNRVSIQLKDEIGKIRSNILEKMMNELSKSVKEQNTFQSERVLNILHDFLNASESRGMAGLRAHEALSRGQQWHLTVIDKIHFRGNDKPPQFLINVHEKDTLWDLKCAVAPKSDTYPELVSVYFRGIALNEDKNSMTLQALNMRDAITVECMKKDRSSERVPLLTGSPQRLTRRAKDALAEIFAQFASNDDQSMSIEDMRAYFIKCEAGDNSASTERIQAILDEYVMQDRLSLEGFLDFYLHAARDRPDHVWNDLNQFKYQYDLRRERSARKEEEALLNAKPDILPRHMLATNNDYFDILFDDCLRSKPSKLRQLAWNLIVRLPTSPRKKQEIMSLNDKQIDWEQLLPSNNMFSLVYALLICESLTAEPESSITEQQLKQRANWRASFLECQWVQLL